MPAATTMSLKTAIARWSYSVLSQKLETNKVNISSLNMAQKAALQPNLYFSEDKGGRFWADGHFSFEDLEALYVIGRHYTRTRDQFNTREGMQDAYLELEGKPNGYFSPSVGGVPTFSANNQYTISVVGETCLDELEAVLLICRKQLKGIQK